MAQLVQYGTFPLQNIGFLEGAHPIAAELVQYGTFALHFLRQLGHLHKNNITPATLTTGYNEPAALGRLHDRAI